MINSEEDPECRAELWVNVPEHLTGNHQNCHHDERKKSPSGPRIGSEPKRNEDFSIWKAGIDIPEAKDALSSFCKKTIKKTIFPFISSRSIISIFSFYSKKSCFYI